jgi:hypothetical protein
MDKNRGGSGTTAAAAVADGDAAMRLSEFSGDGDDVGVGGNDDALSVPSLLLSPSLLLAKRMSGNGDNNEEDGPRAFHDEGRVVVAACDLLTRCDNDDDVDAGAAGRR